MKLNNWQPYWKMAVILSEIVKQIFKLYVKVTELPRITSD